MRTATLHYVYDPLCGWCYGAAPLVAAARTLPGLRVQGHAGGMMTGANRQLVSESLRRYVMQHDQRIAAMSGQPFGTAYFEGLLRDNTAVFDSEPPITAILAAEAVAGRGLDMLASIQTAHYRDGLRIADVSVLATLAAELGLNAAVYATEFFQARHAVTAAHIANSRTLLARVGGQGFPTFALQQGDRYTLLDVGRFLGDPDAWQDWLAQRLAAEAPDTRAASDAQARVPSATRATDGPVCGPDHCTP